MNHQAFQQLLQAPFWSKEVVVWIDDSDSLDGLLTGVNRRDLDLLDLLPDDEDLPTGHEERAEVLRHELDRFLQANRPDGPERVVLVVRNAALLARYAVGLQPLYDWFAGAKSLTVLDVGRIRKLEFPTTLASAITLDATWWRSALKWDPPRR